MAHTMQRILLWSSHVRAGTQSIAFRRVSAIAGSWRVLCRFMIASNKKPSSCIDRVRGQMAPAHAAFYGGSAYFMV
jgi:hypothetical protein